MTSEQTNQQLTMKSKARGCMLGQLAGDALGSLVEFLPREDILKRYPDGVRDLRDGGTWSTLAGQPTDDSEMALMLARMILEKKTYDQFAAIEAYQLWHESMPFDIGTTISFALLGKLSPHSQANGALMRISPLGIFGSRFEMDQVSEWAILDARITHPNQVCLEANVLFAMAIATSIKTPSITPEKLYQEMLNWAQSMSISESLMTCLLSAKDTRPKDYSHQQGWVLIAFQNMIWQLLNAPSAEEGIIDTVMQGGDTDTNGAICGALLGAVYGEESIPSRWTEKILNCRPSEDNPRAQRPRPECFWPVDAIELADQLIEG